MNKKGVINIPNLLSLFRVAAAPVLLILIFNEHESAFKWLLTFAFFTDMIDGFIARKLHQESKLGSILDSIGDSLTIIVGVTGLVHFRYELYSDHSTIIHVVIGLHLFQLGLSLWRYGKPSSFHTWSAKFAALGIGLFILSTFHFGFSPELFYLAILLLILDATEESILVFLLPEWKNDVKGIYWVLKNRSLK
jgi:CDP-diacylglycerol--glycerol-3-phosphate 3-phosphatidyltransferase